MRVYLVLPVILAFASRVNCGLLRGPQSYLPPSKSLSEYAVGSGDASGIRSGLSGGYTSSGQSVGAPYTSVLNQGWTRFTSGQPSNQRLASNEPEQKIWNYANSSPIRQIPNESNGIAGVSGGYSSLNGLSGFNSGIASDNGLRPTVSTVTESNTYSQRTEAKRLPVPQSYQVPANRPVTAPVAVPRPVEVPRPVRIEVPQQVRVEEVRPYPVPESRPYPQTSEVNGYTNVPQPIYVDVPRPYIVVVEKPYPVNVQVPENVQNQYNSAPSGINSDVSQSNPDLSQPNFGFTDNNDESSNGIVNGLGVNHFYSFNSGLKTRLATEPSSIEENQSAVQASEISGGSYGNNLNIRSNYEYATRPVQSSVAENGSSQSENVTQDLLYDRNGGYRY